MSIIDTKGWDATASRIISWFGSGIESIRVLALSWAVASPLAIGQCGIIMTLGVPVTGLQISYILKYTGPLFSL